MRRPTRNAPRRADRFGPARSIKPSAAQRGGEHVTRMSAAEIGALLQSAVGQHQAGRLAEAEALYRQVIAHDPEQPDALHLLGVLAYQSGRSDLAVPLMRRAISYRPNAASYQLNLGNALLALDQTDAAITAYQRAAALQPQDAGAVYNLGNALLKRGDIDAGIAALRRSLQLRPDNPDAHYNLGNALRDADRPAEAIAAYQAAVRLHPEFVDAHDALGMLLHHQFRDVEAAAHFAQVLALQPDHLNPIRGLAAIAQRAQRHTDALPLLRRVAEAVPDESNAHVQLARSLHATGQSEEALAAVVTGLDRLPGDRALARTLVDVLKDHNGAVSGAAAVTVRAGLLTAILDDDRFNVQDLAMPISRVIRSAPEYPGLLAAVMDGIDPLAADIPLPLSLIEEPAVLAGLPRFVICRPEFELILTALRRATLLRADTVAPLPAPFICALAGAAFLTEYAWLVQPDEAARLDLIHARLAEMLADQAADLAAAEPLLLLVALYGRIGLLPGADRLASVPEDRWSQPFAQIIREQVLEPIEERRLAEALPRLTPIDDTVSQAVQAMYEENPYPRWRSVRCSAAEPMLTRYRALCPGEPDPAWPSPLPVLVAGAGTGQHPIQVSLRLPEADVLSVDLSRTSLGYAARMAAHLGIRNLQLAQADILALDVLEERYALIECAGVLHHLADPMAGWAVLRRLLRPDGLMLISLYSERARATIVAAREMIAAQQVPATADGIRAARRQLIDLPTNEPLARMTRFADFYTQSGFRDLVMHVQEHRYTPLQLAAALDALDLQFLGFQLEPPVREAFSARFPDPAALLDLAAWDTFEHENPATFISMFHLWCRPR